MARQPLIREHTAYFSTIERVHELGGQYDSLLRGRAETPGRRRSSVTPAKRASVPRRSTSSPLTAAGRPLSHRLTSAGVRLSQLTSLGQGPVQCTAVQISAFDNLDVLSPVVVKHTLSFS